MELAVATGIPVREWANESDEVIATVVVVLEEISKKRRGR